MKKCLELGVLVLYQLELLYSLPNKIEWALFRNFFIYTIGKKMFDENDVEFNFMIGHILVIYLFL